MLLLIKDKFAKCFQNHYLSNRLAHYLWTDYNEMSVDEEVVVPFKHKNISYDSVGKNDEILMVAEDSGKYGQD